MTEAENIARVDEQNDALRRQIQQLENIIDYYRFVTSSAGYMRRKPGKPVYLKLDDNVAPLGSNADLNLTRDGTDG